MIFTVLLNPVKKVSIENEHHIHKFSSASSKPFSCSCPINKKHNIYIYIKVTREETIIFLQWIIIKQNMLGEVGEPNSKAQNILGRQFKKILFVRSGLKDKNKGLSLVWIFSYTLKKDYHCFLHSKQRNIICLICLVWSVSDLRGLTNVFV